MTPEITQAANDLFNFAIERDDIKWLLATLSMESAAERAACEHELQLLKIISIGWGVSYCLEDAAYKNSLAEHYWREVYDFSRNLSRTAGLMIGQDIDYFETVRKRLDTYVKAMATHEQAHKPAEIIGPIFAEMCGKTGDLFVTMSGSRLFVSTIARVKAYLEAAAARPMTDPGTDLAQ